MIYRENPPPAPLFNPEIVSRHISEEWFAAEIRRRLAIIDAGGVLRGRRAP